MTEREKFENLRKLASAATQGCWTACRMTHLERGDDLTPDELGEYVKNCVLVGGERPFLFVSVEVGGVSVDLCHIGNGPNGPNNAAFIQAANPATVVALLDRIQELEQAARATPALPQGLEPKAWLLSYTGSNTKTPKEWITPFKEEAEMKVASGYYTSTPLYDLSGMAIVPGEFIHVLQDAPEINPSNYDHDQVCRLNTAVNEALAMLTVAKEKS